MCWRGTASALTLQSFKGGRVHRLGLDYRPAIANDRFWRFSNDVNMPDPHGTLLEIPIHTQLVPFWQMLGHKRLKLQNKTRSASQGTPLPRHLARLSPFSLSPQIGLLPNDL